MLQILTIILGSGLVSALATHLLTTRVAETNFRRGKLEQLYLMTLQHRQHLAIKLSSPVDDKVKLLKDEYELLRTCDMLVDLYFPELKPTIKAYQVDFYALDAIVEKGDGVPKAKFLSAVKAMEASGNKFLSQAALTAQRINRPWYLALKDRLPLPNK
jgi:hypothetical protein